MDRRLAVRTALGFELRSRLKGGRSRSAGQLDVEASLIWENDRVDLGHGVSIDDTFVEEFCRRHRVRRLAVFGSLLDDTFAPGSDVDVLVAFEDDSVPGLLGLSAMELELESELGRRVDLRTYGDLSRYFRDEVQAAAREIYAA